MEREILLPDEAEPIQVFGVQDRNLKRVRDHFHIEIHARGQAIHLAGDEEAVGAAAALFERILESVVSGERSAERLVDEATAPVDTVTVARTERRRDLTKLGRTEGQRRYVKAILSHDIVVSTGPAGTGKTYLAVKMAVEDLKAGGSQKLILCRPAVEAGESLGFLPGDFQAKVNPYLRPLYDALHSILDYEQIRRYTDREIIEIVPLAYMRGRTLNDAFIILDEGQNTTPSQMKMFLTRMGESSKIVITGDTTQVDLPPGQLSGLIHARRVLGRVKGISWQALTNKDIVRHPLVSAIVDAYEEFEGAGRRPGGPGDKLRKRKSR